jgi:hypothetical protein
MAVAACSGSAPYPFSRSTEIGTSTAPTSDSTCCTTSSRVVRESRRPSVNAKPELVVARASKPSPSSTRADPASQGFGITNGSPAWRAWNLSAFSGWVLIAVGSELATNGAPFPDDGCQDR